MGRVVKERMGRAKPIRWSADGTNRMLQVRCAVLEDRLVRLFPEWYPRLRRTPRTIGFRGAWRVPLCSYKTFQRIPTFGHAPLDL
jgi:hypothetical protein